MINDKVISSSGWEWSLRKRSLGSQLLGSARVLRIPYIFQVGSSATDEISARLTEKSGYDLPLQISWYLKSAFSHGSSWQYTSYYFISNRFKFTVVSLQDKASCFVTNSPSWVIFGRHHSLLLALCSLDKPIFFLCCCSLVSPPRCSRLGSWVHRCVVILTWNNQFVFDLGKIQFKIVTHELLPSIFVVEENVLAYILQRLVSLGKLH